MLFYLQTYDSKVHPTTETVSVRSELPFHIKEESNDDDKPFYQMKTVQIRPKNSDSTQVTTRSKQPQKEMTQITLIIEVAAKRIKMKSVSAPSTNEPHRSEIQLTSIATEVHELLVGKEKAERKSEDLSLKYNLLLAVLNGENANQSELLSLYKNMNSSTEKYETEIREYEKQINEKTVQCDQLMDDKMKLEN